MYIEEICELDVRIYIYRDKDDRHSNSDESHLKDTKL